MEENFLLIDKEVDWTSNDVVAYLRGKLKVKKIGLSAETKNKRVKVGHAGTLDPFATGLLIIGVGKDATKRLDEFKNLDKTYEATLQLGEISNTQDPEGIITKTNFDSEISFEQVDTVLKTFLGKQKQIPPMHSAKKVKGQRLYKLARQGKEIEREACNIEIYNIKLLNYKYPELSIEIICSTGTYIRQLAQDIGKALECGAYCLELRRTRIGDYSVEDAKKVKEI
ncbi:MAG: tRNA pseudouridine(55) synthase TruB [Candidatus Magasanikbacteria bacterium CG_4_10_14_0_8_um_filter_32_14]|uniref:tRNA pseudouridine synthase B n=2 Tax=Candidatus Magasanikiibacteriota TaxID=1752731 RepID=A0A2M7RB27_9BACT|nr:MAG: tRNA pseudouridine(55) synthase TruB [Candidatus Magasanikbacteria bacterium CG1_02_32_51]PIY93546.1 MAG: tRNA pseudouridine(55) synthase TruB [Candidatus Magasanikbacteria bacterium CG_4_10_14_0_8_um_filter_32_14]